LNLQFFKRASIITGFAISLFFVLMVFSSEYTSAGTYDGDDLARAILQDDSTLLNSFYEDRDLEGHRQAKVLYSLGIMNPTHGDTFALFSTGIAGNTPVTKDQENPGDERGTSFKNKYGNPRDSATLEMTLQVPLYMHYLYYDIQFFTAEWPEYQGTKYNDKLTITVNSPSQGLSQFEFNVNNGYFVLNANHIAGTGFDIFAQSGNPSDVDLVDTTPRSPGSDANASDLIPIGGTTHPVTPNENITVTIHIQDVGDNMFDSAAFIDNLRFSGYAKTEIMARKTVEDLNGGDIECNDTLRYRIVISNTGSADQSDNPGNEFQDYIPDNVSYDPGSAYSEHGNISYNPGENKIIWNGNVPAETSRVLEFKVTVNQDLENGVIISNQGMVYWDSDSDGTNDAAELTDDIYVDDGIDQDSDGETDDDDPTDIIVFGFDNPTYVTEDFSDDISGGNASQVYLSRKWFTTDLLTTSGSYFEIASSYHYSTSKSFKIKLRQSDGAQYWNYYLSNLENANMEWWEIWFTCGDTSEDYNLSLDLQNDNNQDIAKIKFNYVKNGTKPMNWVLELYYYDSTDGWSRLNSLYTSGYLRNNWYKLRIEKNGTNYIDYNLSMTDFGVIDSVTGGQLSVSFSDFERAKWSSNTNSDPAVCPIFFWDEHRIGLTY